MPETNENTFYYDPVSRGFYCSEIHGDAIPNGSVRITEELWQELLDGQGKGKVINPPDADHDRPWLGEPPEAEPAIDESE